MSRSVFPRTLYFYSVLEFTPAISTSLPLLNAFIVTLLLCFLGASPFALRCAEDVASEKSTSADASPDNPDEEEEEEEEDSPLDTKPEDDVSATPKKTEEAESKSDEPQGDVKSEALHKAGQDNPTIALLNAFKEEEELADSLLGELDKTEDDKKDTKPTKQKEPLTLKAVTEREEELAHRTAMWTLLKHSGVVSHVLWQKTQRMKRQLPRKTFRLKLKRYLRGLPKNALSETVRTYNRPFNAVPLEHQRNLFLFGQLCQHRDYGVFSILSSHVERSMRRARNKERLRAYHTFETCQKTRMDQSVSFLQHLQQPILQKLFFKHHKKDDF